jgi:hypothetical protein
MEVSMNRRELSRSLISSIASYALLQSIFQREAFADSVKPVTDRWLRGLYELSRDLRTSAITPGEWQKKVNELFNQISLEDLLTHIDFDKLVQGFEYPDLGVSTKDPELPRLAGLPEKLGFQVRVFGMKKDRAIIPHGHRNMVSCHYVLKGEFWLRQYNRIADDDTHMIIEQTVDEVARVGSHSSISDERNNVHWLIARTDTAFTYDVIIGGLGAKKTEINNVDLDLAEKIGGNQLSVRKITVDEALKKYGDDSQHHA